MSKLNRKEFKSLLLEWNNNFVNERDFRSLDIPEWGTSINKSQEEAVKSVNFDAEMINFPIPNALLKSSKETTLYKIFKNRFSIFEKNEKNYNLIKNAIKDFYEAVVLDVKSYDKDMIEDYDDLIDYESVYNKEKITFNSDEEIDKEKVLNNIDKLFEEKKDVLSGKSREDDVPFFIYFTKTFSEGDAAMSGGGLFKISELPEDVSNSFLKWLFHHDFYHNFQMYSANRVGKHIGNTKRAQLDPENREQYRYIKIKGLEESLNSDDNYASVIPYILAKSQEEAKSFLEENYVSYDEYSKLIKYLQKYQPKQLKSVNDFNREKKENIDKILVDLVETKNNFNTMLSSLKDYIIITSYDITGSKSI